MSTEKNQPKEESFEDLLNESLGQQSQLEGMVVTGAVVGIENDIAIIDVGLKAEGRVELNEFASPGVPHGLEVGSLVDVFVERLEGKNGETVLSREKARREESWIKLHKMFENEERVMGAITGRIRGGFSVDLDGVTAFLPGSQVDIRPIRDITPLLNVSQPFQILKMDRARNNIVISRRAILEESRAVQRAEVIGELEEGKVLRGTVKNLTDYGAFVDLGGVDGLLHVTDISWKRINRPSEVLEIGQEIDVVVTKFNQANQRISLGMKQLLADPWDGIMAKYPIGTKFSGRITNITDYGAFVELESGVEGLVHVTEMSWTKKNLHPNKIVSVSEEVEVMILDIDISSRRISLGLKQCQANPWDDFIDRYKVGDEITGEVRNITEFGVFIGLTDDIDGMVHMSDLDWDKKPEEALEDFTKGQEVKAKILEISMDKERVGLGIKQLTDKPEEPVSQFKKGQIVTTTITNILEAGLEVQLSDEVNGFIKKAELAQDRADQRTDRFAVGERVDAKITVIDKKTGNVNLSVKQMEREEEKKAMANFGSTDSGASLGDILGEALKQRQEQAKDGKAEEKGDDTADAEEKPKKKAAKKPAKKADKDSDTDAESEKESEADEKGDE